jgi:hypothetical protein
MPKTSGIRAFDYGKILGDLRRDINAAINQQNQSTVDATLTTRLFSGLQDDGTYGITAYDSAGNKRATFGGLPDGNHGIAIYDQANDGGYIELNAPVQAQSGSVLSTTSTSFTTLAGSPTLSVTVGHSGQCLVTISALIGCVLSTSAEQAIMQLYVDGASTLLFAAARLSSSPGDVIQITGSNSRLITGLSQGTHTLSLEYTTLNGGSCSFGEPSITAIPY